MIAIAKTYLLSIIEWKAKKLIKAIVSPVEDDEAPPSKPERSSESSNSTPAQTAPVTPTPASTPAPVVSQPVTPKYQNPPPPHHNSSSGIGPEDFATAIIKVACILVIGVVILNAVVASASINNNSAFSGVFASVQANIQSGYTLAALMVLALGAGAIMHFLGFM